MKPNAQHGDEPKGSHLHIRVTQEQKARWVKQAQARGMKLSAWVCDKLETAESERPTNYKTAKLGAEETPLIVTEPDGSQWVALEDYLKVVGVSERLDDDNDVELWECTKCGRTGSVGRCCGIDTRTPAKYK